MEGFMRNEYFLITEYLKPSRGWRKIVRYWSTHKAGAKEETKKQGKYWQSEEALGTQAIQRKPKFLVSPPKIGRF